MEHNFTLHLKAVIKKDMEENIDNVSFAQTSEEQSNESYSNHNFSLDVKHVIKNDTEEGIENVPETPGEVNDKLSLIDLKHNICYEIDETSCDLPIHFKKLGPEETFFKEHTGYVSGKNKHKLPSEDNTNEDCLLCTPENQNKELLGYTQRILMKEDLNVQFARKDFHSLQD
nr:putative zinc finger protein 66 [Biomphalaria glabrata]